MLLRIIEKQQKRGILNILLLLLFIVKVIVIVEFGFKFTGSDDTIFWQCLSDFSNGIFHEPFFYGQNYNFALESLLSVPLVKCGVPIYYALPIMSALIGVFPFVMFALILFKKGFEVNAYIFLLIPLALPIEYDIITAISRGFTSGLFCCSFLIYPILNPNNFKSFVILGLSVSFGYILNPNSLVFSFPVCIYLLLMNINIVSFYITTVISSLPALIILYFSQQFYANNPDYLVHQMWILEFSFERMLNGLASLDKFFRHLTPVLWIGNWLVVLLIAILGGIALKRNWKKGLSIIVTFIFIILLLGVNKIHDDIGVIFLSSTRMFLAIPLLFGLGLLWSEIVLKENIRSKLVVMSIAASVFLIKISLVTQVVKTHTTSKNFGPIAIKKLDDLEKECTEIQQLSSKYNADIIVFLPAGDLNVPNMEFYNYGCSILNQEMCSSVMNVYERRTWVFLEEKISKRKTVLLFNLNPAEINENNNFLDYEVVQNNPTIVLLRNNNKSLLELSELFNFQYKRNTY